MRILYGLIVAVIILLIGACAWGAGNTKGKLACCNSFVLYPMLHRRS